MDFKEFFLIEQATPYILLQFPLNDHQLFFFLIAIYSAIKVTRFQAYIHSRQYESAESSTGKELTCLF